MGPVKVLPEMECHPHDENNGDVAQNEEDYFPAEELFFNQPEKIHVKDDQARQRNETISQISVQGNRDPFPTIKKEREGKEYAPANDVDGSH